MKISNESVGQLLKNRSYLYRKYSLWSTLFWVTETTAVAKYSCKANCQNKKKLAHIIPILTHWHLNEIACDPPLIPWRFFGLFQSERNHRHKIRSRDLVELKLNKWRVKILKNISKRNSTWSVKLIRIQEIILFLYRALKFPTEAEKTDLQKWVNYWHQRTKNETKYNRISFLYYNS